jgi:hypothetical protein
MRALMDQLNEKKAAVGANKGASNDAKKDDTASGNVVVTPAGESTVVVRDGYTGVRMHGVLGADAEGRKLWVPAPVPGLTEQTAVSSCRDDGPAARNRSR